MKKDSLFTISMLSLLAVAIIFHTIRAMNVAGFEAYKRSKYETALKWLLPLANKNNTEAQILVGNLFTGVIGVNQNDEKTFKWYLRAAESGNPRAQHLVATMLKNGKRIPQDFSQASRWFQKAAESGLAEAQWELGELYNSGKGVEKNIDKSIKWHQRAKKNIKAAIKWYRPLALKGNTQAQITLAKILESNFDESPDNRIKAGRWYKEVALEAENSANHADDPSEIQKYLLEVHEFHFKAAKLGNTQSQQELGIIYLFGKGVPKNIDKAAKWLHQAANSGDMRAQMRMGELYKNGLGVPKNYSTALKWFRKSATKGFSGAQLALGIMYENGTGVPQDFLKAIDLYKKAAVQNENDAHCRLAIMHEAGNGTSKNLKIALMHAYICTSIEYKYLVKSFNNKMTQEKIEEAKHAVRDWKKKYLQ